MLEIKRSNNNQKERLTIGGHDITTAFRQAFDFLAVNQAASDPDQYADDLQRRLDIIGKDEFARDLLVLCMSLINRTNLKNIA